MTFTKIPSLFKNIPLDGSMKISPKIPAKEGVAIAVQVLEHEGKKNDIDYANGRLGKLVSGDVIPAMLGYRKANVEFAGVVPKKIKPGDGLYLLCESGLVGSISGVYEAWGEPMKVKVLGALLRDNGTVMTLSDFALESKPGVSNAPIIAFLSTRMDCGKTTMAAKVIHALTQSGKKAAAGKVTGVAFTQDLYKLKEFGAKPVLDFVDFGLPSTCNGDPSIVVTTAKKILHALKSTQPDCIVLEFGDSLMGEYHVYDIIKNPMINKQLSCVIVAAFDFAGIAGMLEKVKTLGLTIDLVTGPVVNSQTGIAFVEKHFGIPAESNQHDIPKTMAIVQGMMAKAGL